jgi:hypothetical protein
MAAGKCLPVHGLARILCQATKSPCKRANLARQTELRAG